VTNASDTLSLDVGIIVSPTSCCGFGANELASPLIQVLPEVVQGKGRSVFSPNVCVNNVVAATEDFLMLFFARL